MDNTRENLLRTTKLDVDVAINNGNDHDILPILLQQYRSLCPEIAPMKEAKYRANYQSQAEALDAQERVPAESNTPEAITAANVESSPPNPAESEDKSYDPAVVTTVDTSAYNATGKEQNPDGVTKPTTGANVNHQDESDILVHKALRALDPSVSVASERLRTTAVIDQGRTGEVVLSNNHLQEMGVDCHQMKWQVYDKTVRKEDGQLFDFILTDPPYGTLAARCGAGTEYSNYVDDDEKSAVAQFARRVLKPGAWAFVFTSVKYFGDWYSCFKRNGFSGPQYPFVIMKNTENMQEHRGDYPQNACEYALFAKSPGQHPEGFKVDLRSPYYAIPVKEKRRFAAASNVPVPVNKLMKTGTKSPILTEEKNTDLLVELMTTFCPEGGAVLDIYGGTLTTAIASMLTGRRCTVVECSAERFRLAHARLRLTAQQLALHQNLMEPSRKRPCIDTENRLSALTGHSVTTNAAKVSASKKLSGTSRREEPRGSSGEHVDDEIEEPKVSLAPEQFLHAGDKVFLLLSGRRVATSQLQLPVDNEDEGLFRRFLHGHQLAPQQAEGQTLVAIFGTDVFDGDQAKSYPYKYKGQEKCPEILGDLDLGFHAWDLDQMELFKSD